MERVEAHHAELPVGSGQQDAGRHGNHRGHASEGINGGGNGAGGSEAQHRALRHPAFLCEQPATRQRQLALMAQLASIRFDASRGMAEQIVKYEELIKEYERVSGSVYPDDLRYKRSV